MSRYLPWLETTDDFPPLDEAFDEPNGLLAAGADLSPDRLVDAYKKGIFPWFSDGEPILWWSPHPRCVIFPNQVHISKSLRKHIRKANLRLSFNEAFEEVIHYCSRTDGEEGVWITEEMKEAYCQLNLLGNAHSVEVWRDNTLVGGLYGLAIGRCFFGESMFSHETNASKVAFVHLCQQLDRWNYSIIDCQVENPHLMSLGAQTINRSEFLSILENNVDKEPKHHAWIFDKETDN